MTLPTVVTGQTILAAHVNAFTNALTGLAAEPFTLIYNAAGSVVLQPSSNPAAGTELIQVKNSTGTVQLALSSDGNVYAANGVVGAPALSFESDKDTGFYNVAANKIGVTAGGALILQVDNRVRAIGGVVFSTDETTTSRDIRIDQTSGGTNSNGGVVQLTAVGTQNGVVGAGASILQLVPATDVPTSGQINSEILLFNIAGTNYERFGIAWFSSDVVIDTSKNGSGTVRGMTFNIGGSTAMRLENSPAGDVTIYQHLRLPNGTAAAPSLTFTNDLTKGLYHFGTGTLGFAANGVAQLRLDDGVIRPVSNGYVDLGGSTLRFNNLYVENVVANTIVSTPLSATASAGLRVPHGAAPTSPVNGDVWTTTGGMFCRINGVTKSVNLT